MRLLMIATCAAGLFAASPSAYAIGCLSGAVAGGVAGHYAGHHAVLGAVGGCYAGHQAKKALRRRDAERAAHVNDVQQGTVVAH